MPSQRVDSTPKVVSELTSGHDPHAGRAWENDGAGELTIAELVDAKIVDSKLRLTDAEFIRPRQRAGADKR